MGLAVTSERKKIPEEFLKVFNYSKGQVMRMRERLELVNEEYGVTRSQLISVFKCTETEADLLLKTFDADHSGKVDIYEFICGLIIICQATLEEKAKLIFGLYDFDGNKFITRDELIIMMLNSLSALQHITADEPPSTEEVEAVAQTVMRLSDSNNDRRISLPEFTNCVTKCKEILTFLRSYFLISKDDLRPNFGSASELDVPEVDSDLELELMQKGRNPLEFSIHNTKSRTEIGGLTEPLEKFPNSQDLIIKGKYESIAKIQSSDYIPRMNDAEAPESNLSLEYIHGYRCDDTRNNIRYNKAGEVVYHAAAVGVVLCQEKNTQRHFFEHRSEIVSLAMHPNMLYAATGDAGVFPQICVWDTSTMECLARISGLLTKAIAQICFSSDGNYLAASAADEYHCIAIYDWDKYTTTAKNVASKAKKANSHGLVATGQSTTADILYLLFNPPGEQLIVSSVGELNFVTFAGGVIKMEKSECDTGEDKQALMCAAFVGTTLVTGTFKGQLLVWKGKKYIKEVKAHRGGVNAIWPRPNLAGIITGSSDGTIKVWDQCLNELRTVSLVGTPGLSCIVPKIRSVCENAEGKILAGTRCGEIVEITHESKDGTGKDECLIRMHSHYKEQVCGLAVHPSKLEFATLSRDSMFAVWDITNRKQIGAIKVDIGGNTVAYAKNGEKGAMGLINGQVVIFNTSTYTISAMRKDTQAAITEVKFSPDSKLLAAAAEDTYVYLYWMDGFKVAKKLRTQNGVSHMDFSEDSGILQFNTVSNEILYYSVTTGKPVTGPMQDVLWESWTCPLGWPVLGVGSYSTGGTLVQTVDRSVDQKAIVTGDKSGNVRLFKYPCPIEASSCLVYKGHSAVVSNVRFSYDGNYLISIGAADKCIFQWKYSHDKEGEAAGENIKVGKDFFVDTSARVKVPEKLARPEEEDWKKRAQQEVELSKPKAFAVSSDAGGLPDANVQIKYVHGYRAEDVRNNLKWTKSGSVLYHTAALGVVLHPGSNVQSFFVQHDKDIVSIAIHPNGMIAATGEMVGADEYAEIYAWNIETKDILACLKGFHVGAVRHLRFSPNGSKLLSIGEDKDHSFALYDWMSNKIIASSPVDRGEVTACEFKSDSEFVTCGVKHIKFWSITGYNLTCLRGIIEDFSPIVSAAYAFPSRTCVTGTSSGKLIVWADRHFNQSIAAHTGPVLVLQAKNNLLISGGEDGLLITWDGSFKQLSVTDLKLNPGINPCIRAVDINKIGCYIIGTKGSEILKLQKGEVSVLMHGHFSGELWGLCVSPNGTKFATCGGDRTVRVWTLNSLLLTQTFEEDGRACDWSSNSNFIVFATVNGHIYTLKPSEKLSIVDSLHSTFKAGQWIEDVKISPNNQLIAFGAHMGVSPVEVMRVNEQGSDLQKLKVINIGLTSPLIHLDWSLASDSLVVNSEDFGLVFVNVPTGSVLPASACSSIEWHTWTCVLGLPVKGLFSQFCRHLDIGTVCRSHSKKIVATGDDYSKVKLYKYPCLVEAAPFKCYIGHSSKVSKLRFLNEDKYLVSAGCKDKTVIIWSTELGAVGEVESEEVDTSGIEDLYDETDTLSEAERLIPSAVEIEEEKKARYAQMMTIQEMIQGIKEPTGFAKPMINHSHAPKLELELKYVHGYRARDCKNNVHYLRDGSIAYHAATVGIVLDKTDNTQKFFLEHRSAVLAIAFHPDGIRAATGDVGEKPVIYVWDSTTCSRIAKFTGHLEKGIRSLAYSPSGDYLAAVDMSDYHVLAIYDVNNAILLALSKIDPTLVLQVVFQAENDLITVGPKHFMFWQMSNKSLTSRKGQFEGKNDILGCVAAEKELVLTGNALGDLYLWNDRKVVSSKQIHTKPIDCVTIAQQIILTGGRDAKVNILDKQFAVLMCIDMADKAYGSISPGIRALSLDRMGKNLLVGTFGSEIFELNIEPSCKIVEKCKSLVRGHCSPRKMVASETWGLAVFPDGSRYATVGEDATLRIWNVATRTQEKLICLIEEAKGFERTKEIVIQEIQNSAKGRAVDIGPCGELAVVGFKDGSVRVIDLRTEVTKHSKVYFDSAVSVIKISPDCRHVAIGSQGSLIHVFTFPSMELVSVLKGHAGSILHLDWSQNSLVLHSNSTDRKLLFWAAETGKLLVNGETTYRNEQWATWTCSYGWPVQGIVYEQTTMFLSCMRSWHIHDRYQLLAAGDDLGLIRVYRYPCLKRGACYLLGRGHSSPVSCVRFTADDKCVITTGLRDGCVFQWGIC